MKKMILHDDIIKWKYFPRYWPFVTKASDAACARINGWVNNGEAGDLRRHRAHYDVIVMNYVKFIRWHCGCWSPNKLTCLNMLTLIWLAAVSWNEFLGSYNWSNIIVKETAIDLEYWFKSQQIWEIQLQMLVIVLSSSDLCTYGRDLRTGIILCP